MSGLRRVRDSVWGARWWIVASVMLCAIDIAIRHKVFHTGKWHDLLLLAFYSSAAIAPAFLLGRCCLSPKFVEDLGRKMGCEK